jgi:HK97 family phage major capsid protein
MLEKLKAKYGDLQNQIDTIKAKAETEERELTAEDFTAIEALLDSQDALKAQIKTAERMAAQEAEAPAAPTAAQMGVVAVGPAAEASPYSLAEYMQDIAVSARNIAAAGAPLPRVVNYQQKILAAATGANETVPADGGFLVGTDFGGAIMNRVYNNNEVISRCTRRQISAASNKMTLNGVDETSRATGSRWGGIRSYWMAEAASKTSSKPKFRAIDLELNKHAVLFYATDELLADSTMLGPTVEEAVADEIAFANQEAIINGTGAGQPQGILLANALISQAKEAGQAAATIVYENILKMWTRKWGPGSRYVWLVNSEIFPQLAQMNLAVGTGGAPVFLPAGGASVAPYSTLMGLPIIEIEQAAALGTVGDIMLVDLSQYIVAEKGGVQAAMSIHVNFTNDETVFRWVTRIDGQSIWNAPLTPFKGSATKSPFVALATRS